MIVALDPLPKETKATAKYLQIRQHVRQLIKSGKLPPGSRLPGLTTLAKQWGTNYFTVYSAFTPLVNNGLIERTPMGTFVRSRTVQLKSVALYTGSNPWQSMNSIYFQRLCYEIEAELGARGIYSRLFVDRQTFATPFTPLQDLQRAVQKGEIQGLVGIMLNRADVRWLESFGIPTSLLFTAELRDSIRALEKGYARLKADGCRTIGMLSTLSGGLYPLFEEAIREHGLKTHPSWLKHRSGDLPVPGAEEFGYHAFKELWRQKKRPDGLLVSPDWTCRGAITAILELGVRIPLDLQLVLYRNSGMNYICPWPIPMLVADVGKTAASLIDKLKVKSTRPWMGPPLELEG